MKDLEYFYGMTVEQIREELKTLPVADETLRLQMQFTGSGMTEHGFTVSSSAGWSIKEDDYEIHNGIKLYHAHPAIDEAEIIYNHVNMWGPNGMRRDPTSR